MVQECGKATSVKTLNKCLQENKGVLSIYVDLAQLEQEWDYLRSFLSEIKGRQVHILFLDNAQLWDTGLRICTPFAVATFSPGARARDVSHFMKMRGDGKCETVYFCPFDLKWSKKFLNHFGVTVNDDDSDLDTSSQSNTEPTKSTEGHLLRI